MAANDNIALSAGAWTLITSGDVEGLRVQNLGNGAIYIKARVGTGALSSIGGSICLAPLMTIGADMPLSDLFPGVSGANRVYAYSDAPGLVSVSHA